MITFSLDGLPQNRNHSLSTDYNSKILYTAICDPLFKYDKNKKEYACNASDKYEVGHDFKKYVITLRNDLHYSNGKKIYPTDYKNAIDKVIKNNKILSIYFKNVKEITCSDNKIIFCLFKADKYFINKLSLYQLSPINCGAFTLKLLNSKEIQLYPNKFYRKPMSINLRYLIQTNEKEHINFFENNKVDITNNTLYPINYENKINYYNEEESFINYNLEISTKIPIKLRKNLVTCINKTKIVNILNNNALEIDTFLIDKHHLKEIKNDFLFYKKTIMIGYNNFYPNKLVAESIYNDLSNNNYNVKLVEYSYQDSNDDNTAKYDINIVLNYFEFYDPLYFYDSLYFKRIMKNNKIYHLLLDWYKKTGNSIFLRSACRMFRTKFIKEPLVTIKSRYLTNEKTKGFSFLELNYDLFKKEGEDNYDRN